jgi:hypothetical protein
MKGDFSEGLDTPDIAPEPDRPAKRYLLETEIRSHVGAFLVLIALTAGLLVYELSFLSRWLPQPGERTVVLIVMTAGAIGGLIHAATSFATFAGNRELLRSWLPWFYLRAPIGVLLALLVYLAARAQIFGKIDLGDRVTIYRLAFMGGIAGLFSKQVTDKLNDLVSSLFTPAQPPKRSDALKHSTEKAADDGTESAAASTASDSPKFSELIREAQAQLIALGHLPASKPDGHPADDGILSDETRAAVDRFFQAAGVDAADRADVMGVETSPDYWPNLLRRLEDAAR